MQSRLLSYLVVVLLILTWGGSVKAEVDGAVFDPNDFVVLEGGAQDLSGATSIVFSSTSGGPTYSVDGGASVSGLVAQTESGSDVAVFCFQAINMNQGSVTITGDIPIVLLSKSTANIAGVTVSVDGADAADGPSPAVDDPVPGVAGGADGLPRDQDYTESSTEGGPGHGINYRTDGVDDLTDNHESGGGGGYGGRGGTTHPTEDTVQGDMAGATYGDARLNDLLGGSAGAGSHRPHNNNSTAGGAGGGAIEIAAVESITIASDGAITANGGAGGDEVNGDHYFSCGGGGSGGSILLAAPVIVNNGVIQAKGGKGGGLVSYAPGEDDHWTYGGGGGGGGRVAFYADNATKGVVDVSGGEGGVSTIEGRPGNIYDDESYPGEDGTVMLLGLTITGFEDGQWSTYR